jgi:acyl carrier protein
MDAKLAQIFKKLFDVESFSEELSVDNVKKWDSINHLALIIEIENEFDLKFSIVESIQMTCVKEIQKQLKKKLTTEGQ